jgi:hypothetical protein
MNSIVRITSIQEKKQGNLSRVTAEVNGFPIWFESEDIELHPSPEAYASAFLAAGLIHEARVVLEDPLSASWRKNIAMLLSVYNEWWGFAQLAPEAPEAAPPVPANGNSKETALLFSGGVDSFYSLLRGRTRPQRLLFIHGYDIPLEDTARMEPYYRTFLEVAEKARVKPVLVRTNLRHHPLIRPPHWMQVHGGALAGAGHLLTQSLDRLLISSTNPYSVSLPWGSHWRIDELWSSEKLHVQHTGAERTRNDKLREIAAEPIVQQHLRVCLENKSTSGNCCQCEKCLRTMLVLHQAGQLEKFKEVFDLSVPLEERLKTVKPPTQTMGILLKGYHDILNRGLEPKLDRAVRDFLKKYEVTKSTRTGRFRRILGPRVTSWLREKIYA